MSSARCWWASVRGGPTASTVSVVVGALFPLSGVANVLVLDTPLNMLAFQLTNVVFSLVVGAALLFVGAYGRFTGGLPHTSPYAHVTVVVAPAPGALAAAERAVAQLAATAEQLAHVRAAAFRTHEARREAFANAPRG